MRYIFKTHSLSSNIRSYSEKSPPGFDVLNQKPEDTIFAKIVSKKINSTILYEDDITLCIKDIKPIAPHHYLVLPKKPIGGLSVLKEEDSGILGHCLFVASLVAKQQGIKEGYRLVVNEGKHGQQSVRWLHFHLIGGKQLGWPPSSEN